MMDMDGDTKKYRILLVEDDMFMIDLLGKEMTGSGLEVEVAKTGKEAIEKFGQNVPDLVLLDILLPDQDGLEALRQIRRLPGGSDAKVIVLSNLAEGPKIEEARRLGVVNYFVKANLTMTEILDNIKKALGV